MFHTAHIEEFTMSEASGNQAPKLQDPELTPSQLAVKELCDDILSLRSEPVDLTCEGFATRLDPEEVQQRLRDSSLGDLMLKDGDSLSAMQTDDYQPELGLFVGQAKLLHAQVVAWGWDYDKRRVDPSGPDKPPYTIIGYPGEKDWIHQLDVSLWYSNEEHEASQTVTAYTTSASAGTLPSMLRDVVAPAYAEQGYEGHNQVSRPAHSDDEVLAFVALARELFDARIAR